MSLVAPVDSLVSLGDSMSSTSLILAGTGHRPPKLGGYSDATFTALRSLAGTALTEIKPTTVISGMALGWDQALALAALDLGIPLIAAVPFKDQESMWPAASQAQFRAILARASKVNVVCDGGYAAWKMQRRNERMVDQCHVLLALWDGSSGGTGNCIRYAQSVNRRIVNLWSRWGV